VHESTGKRIMTTKYSLQPAGRVLGRLSCLLSIVVLAGCSMGLPTVPALSDSGRHQPGKIVWHDLVTPNMSASQAFYSALLGWSFEEVGSGYAIARNNGQVVAGIAELGDADRLAYWIPLMSVVNVDKAVDRTESAGGESLLDPFDLPGRGRVGLVRDPQGAAFGLIRTTAGDPPDMPPALNGWLWHEIWSDNSVATASFYRKLAEFDIRQEQQDGDVYRYLASQQQPRVGLGEKPNNRIDNTWIAYIRVENIQTAVDNAISLGATILLNPRPSIRNGSIAVIVDPQGAGLVLQEWEE